MSAFNSIEAIEKTYYKKTETRYSIEQNII